MTPAEVRTRLTHALRLDLVGPEPGNPQVTEILNGPPSRWYFTGFLVPAAAPLKQKQDQDDAQGRLGLTEPATAADEDDNKDEAPAACRRRDAHSQQRRPYESDGQRSRPLSKARVSG